MHIIVNRFYNHVPKYLFLQLTKEYVVKGQEGIFIVTKMASNESVLPTSNEKSYKTRILDTCTYQNLCDFIKHFNGLAIDCEMDLKSNFPHIHRLTLKAILETEFMNRNRSQHWQFEKNAKNYFARYDELLKENPFDSSILLNIARTERIGPVMLCRSLLKSKYDINLKMDLAKLIRFPHLIEDQILSANVLQCLCSDSQDGPLIDLKRRVLGEEYEFKLKCLAKKAGMHFYDENDLRRLGYDKTPDIKIILPFLYKGQIINWIESKAKFGDPKTHKYYIQQQLSSYCNRFGSGIIIYWFGYHESTPEIPDNSMGITVLDDFPSQSDINLLVVSEKTNFEVTNITEDT